MVRLECRGGPLASRGGTPSDLMPRELGNCGYEPGSEGQVLDTLTNPSIVSYEVPPRTRGQPSAMEGGRMTLSDTTS